MNTVSAIVDMKRDSCPPVVDMKRDFAVTMHSGCDVTGCEPVIGCESVTYSNGRWVKSDDIVGAFETLWCDHYSIEMRNKRKIKHSIDVET